MTQDIPIQSAETVLDVAELLAKSGSVTLSEVVAEMDKPRSTVHDYLKSLQETGYVVKENGRYRISTRFLAMGVSAREKMQLFELAQPEIDNLAEQTGEHASLMVEESGLGVLLYISKGEQALDLGVSTGWRMALPTSAPGKAILAHLPDSRVESILDEHGLPEITQQTITEHEALDEELDTVREQGYATDRGERVEGVRAISVPVVTEGRVHGAITISGPTRRMSGSRFEQELPDLLMRAANVVEIQYTLDQNRT